MMFPDFQNELVQPNQSNEKVNLANSNDSTMMSV